MMRVIISLLLAACLALCGCSASNNSNVIDSSKQAQTSAAPDFADLSDPAVLDYLEYDIYSDIIDELDSNKYYVENVEAVYVSKEYLEELESNSQENIYFGYALSDVIDAFGDTPYVFTVGDDGQTTVVPFEGYGNTWNEVMQNVAIGTGVILVCITVSAVTGGAGMPVASAIFAVSAKTGTLAALSGGAISGAITGVVTGVETQDLNETLKATALAASDGYKWGAIMGAATDAAGEGLALKGASSAELPPQTVAQMQHESKYPLDVVKGFTKTEQYEICQEARLTVENIGNKPALIREIDLNYTKDGITNLERMLDGKAALDPTGTAYELHHIGQQANSTLAILTKAEHMQGGNNVIWHEFGVEGVDHGAVWATQRSEFWTECANILQKAA